MIVLCCTCYFTIGGGYGSGGRGGSGGSGSGGSGGSGWQTSSILSSDRCDIDSISNTDITSEVFLKEYVYGNKPVIIRGALLSKKFGNIRKMFERTTLMKLLKNEHTIFKSKVPYPKLFLMNETKTSLKEYFDGTVGRPLELEETVNESAPSYIFMPCPATVKKKVSNVSPHFLSQDLWSKQTLCEFYAGIKNTGSPPHWHVLAMNFLVYGKKKWMLGPPRDSFHSRTPALDSFHVVQQMNEGNTKKYLHCTQHAGDLLLVPQFWMHTTLNEEHTVGYAMEFDAQVTLPTVKQPNH